MNDDTTGTTPTPASSSDYERVHAALDQLFAAGDTVTNKHDLATVAIHVCIEAGVNRGKDIINALGEKGFNRKHVGLTLRQLRGSDPARHEWERDEDGVYRSLR